MLSSSVHSTSRPKQGSYIRKLGNSAPIDGVILAAGAQTLTVEVDVVPEEGS